MDCGHECPNCGHVFTQRKSLLRHLRQACKPYLKRNPEVKERQDAETLRNRTCAVCMKVFSQRSNMLTHQANVCRKNQRSAFDGILPVAVSSTSTPLTGLAPSIQHGHTEGACPSQGSTNNGMTSSTVHLSEQPTLYPSATCMQLNITPSGQLERPLDSNVSTNEDHCSDCGQSVSKKHLKRHQENSCKARKKTTLCPNCGLFVLEKRIHIHGLQ
jgi:hypothetical protein